MSRFAVHHIAISVSDVNTSATFYELFDFKRVGGWEPDDGSYEIVNLRNGDVMLELFCYANTQPLPAFSKEPATDLPVLGVKHFGLNVDSIDEAKEKLQAKGFEILNEDFNEDRSGANYFFVRDPDGILVEIIEDNRGY
jgi:glyoxylase I family protein